MVTTSLVFFADPVGKGVKEDGSFSMPKGEAGAFFVEGKEVKLFAEGAMISFFGFKDHLFVFFEGFGRREGETVDAGEHGVFFGSTPVCSGERVELPGFGWDFGGVFDMGSAAKVEKISDLVEGEVGFAFSFKFFNQLEFVGLVGENFFGFFVGFLGFFEGEGLVNEFDHLFLDA